MIPGQKIDEEVLSYIQSGFKAYLYEDKDLDTAFNLKQTRIQAKAKENGRDYNLRLAGKHISGKGVTARARALHDAIVQFESRIWPKWKELELPPAGCSELNFFLFRAKKYKKIDLSIKQLIRIL